MQTLSQELDDDDLCEQENYMSDKMLFHFNLLLETWKRKLSAHTHQHLKMIQQEASREADPVDVGTLEKSWETTFALLANDKTLMQEIDQALVRIERGDYGYCEETGDPIGLKRLQAWPIARHTVKTQETKDKQAK